jgi:hypothetical protein
MSDTTPTPEPTCETERAAVVAFLREQSRIALEKAEAAVQPPENERLARDYFAAKISLERAAAAIGRGEHHERTT